MSIASKKAAYIRRTTKPSVTARVVGVGYATRMTGDGRCYWSRPPGGIDLVGLAYAAFLAATAGFVTVAYTATPLPPEDVCVAADGSVGFALPSWWPEAA